MAATEPTGALVSLTRFALPHRRLVHVFWRVASDLRTPLPQPGASQ